MLSSLDQVCPQGLEGGSEATYATIHSTQPYARRREELSLDEVESISPLSPNSYRFVR